MKFSLSKSIAKRKKDFGWKRQFEKQKVGTKNGVYKKCIKNFSFPNLIIVDICNIRKSHWQRTSERNIERMKERMKEKYMHQNYT